MPRPIQKVFPVAGSKFYGVCLGDSLTFNEAIPDTPIYEQWPTVLQGFLQALGCSIRLRNLAKAGATSANSDGDMLYKAQIVRTFPPDTCALGLIFIGANDPGAGITTADTLANIKAAIKLLKYGCLSVVADQTALPAVLHAVSGRTVQAGDRAVVLADGSSKGGAVVSSNVPAPPRIGGAGGGAQSVWQCVAPIAGENGWVRIALEGNATSLAADYCPRVVVVSMQYQNFAASAADNNDVTTGKAYTEGTSTDSANPAVVFASYATLRTGAQQLAVLAESVYGLPAGGGVIYADIYSALSRWIKNGNDVQGSAAWHAAAGNQHFNANGNGIAAQAILDAIVTQQPGWIAALKPV